MCDVAELENHLGISEKTLAEFIIELAKGKSSVKEFQQALISNHAEMPESLVQTIWNVIQRLTQVLITIRRASVHVFCFWCWRCLSAIACPSIANGVCCLTVGIEAKGSRIRCSVQAKWSFRPSNARQQGAS